MQNRRQDKSVTTYGQSTTQPAEYSANTDSASTRSDSHIVDNDSAGEGGSFGEWLFYAVITVVAIGFFLGSFSYTEAAGRWPLILSTIVLVLLAAYVTVRAVQHVYAKHMSVTQSNEKKNENIRDTALRTGDHDKNSSEDVMDPSPERNGENHDARAALLAALSFVGLALLAYSVGFLLAGAIFIAGYMIVAGQRRPSIIISVTLGMTVCIYLLFQSTLNAPLTEGEWFWFSLDWLPV